MCCHKNKKIKSVHLPGASELMVTSERLISIEFSRRNFMFFRWFSFHVILLGLFSLISILFSQNAWSHDRVVESLWNLMGISGCNAADTDVCQISECSTCNLMISRPGLGPMSIIIKTVFPGLGIPIINIRWSSSYSGKTASLYRNRPLVVRHFTAWWIEALGHTIHYHLFRWWLGVTFSGPMITQFHEIFWIFRCYCCRWC